MSKFIKLTGKRKDLLGKVSWLFAGKFGVLLINMVTAVALTRHLGAASYGLFSGLSAFVALGDPVTAAGLNAIVSKRILEAKESEATVLGTANRIRMGATLVVNLTLLFIAFFFLKYTPEQMLYVGILILGTAAKPFSVITFWFEAKGMSQVSVWAEMTSSIVRSLLMILLIALKAPLIPMFCVQAAVPIISNVVTLSIYKRRRTHSDRWNFDKALAKELLKNGSLLMLSAVALTINLKIDQVILLQIAGKAEVGIYAAAARISEIWYTLPTLMMVALFPSLFAAKKAGPKAYARKLQQLYDIFAIPAVSLALLVTFTADRIVPFAFGPQFKASAPVLVIHIWASVFVFMRTIFSRWLVLEDFYIYSVVTQSAGALMNVAFNFVLIPQFGAIGAAYATVISYGTSGFLSLFLTKNTRAQGVHMAMALLSPIRLPLLILRSRAKG